MSVPASTVPWIHARPIRKGATAEVFSARSPRIGRDLVIKHLDDDHTRTPLSRRRFSLESTLALQLDHPHLIRGVEYGIESGRPYLAMNEECGRTLSQLMRAGPAREEQVLRIARDIASALAHLYAHHGVIAHRDVKPDNIVMREDGSAVLCDLGIVLTRENIGWTHPGAVVGSPHYLAPEQWSTPDSVDVRADIYALGSVVFELLTATRLFPGATATEIRERHLDPGWARRRLEQGVSRPWRRVLERAVAPDAEGRYRSMREFDAALRELGRRPRAPVLIRWFESRLFAALAGR